MILTNDTFIYGKTFNKCKSYELCMINYLLNVLMIIVVHNHINIKVKVLINLLFKLFSIIRFKFVDAF